MGYKRPHAGPSKCPRQATTGPFSCGKSKSEEKHAARRHETLSIARPKKRPGRSHAGRSAWELAPRHGARIAPARVRRRTLGACRPGHAPGRGPARSHVTPSSARAKKRPGRSHAGRSAWALAPRHGARIAPARVRRRSPGRMSPGAPPGEAPGPELVRARRDTCETRLQRLGLSSM